MAGVCASVQRVHAGWAVDSRAPAIELAVFADAHTHRLFLCVNLTRHRKGKVSTGELLPHLPRAENEEYCRRVLQVPLSNAHCQQRGERETLCHEEASLSHLVCFIYNDIPHSCERRD